MIDPREVCQWNVEAGNPRGELDPELEIDMLNEELIETAKSLKSKDVEQSIDGLLDLIYVAIGSLHKIGLFPDQIAFAFEKVVESNWSKVPFEQDENWKVQKSKNFHRPDFTEFNNPHEISSYFYPLPGVDNEWKQSS